MIRTSLTHPIQLDPIATGSNPMSKLYVTLAPGKKDNLFNPPKSRKYFWDRDLDLDLSRMKNVYGVHWIVSLLEPEETQKIGLENYSKRATTQEFGFISYPIRDLSTPSNFESFHQLILKIRELLNLGYSIVVHCLGGTGRAPTVAAGALISGKIPPEEAIKWVQQQRKRSLRRKNQQKFLLDYANYLKSQS